MSTQQATFVRASMIEASPAPSLERGAASWLRRNLFATPKDSVLTIISLLILAWLVPPRNPMALHRCRLERRWPGRLRNAVAGRFAAGTLERRMLGVRQCEIRPVPFRPLSARRALASCAGRHSFRPAPRAYADTQDPIQGTERASTAGRPCPSSRRSCSPAAGSALPMSKRRSGAA